MSVSQKSGGEDNDATDLWLLQHGPCVSAEQLDESDLAPFVGIDEHTTQPTKMRMQQIQP